VAQGRSARAGINGSGGRRRSYPGLPVIRAAIVIGAYVRRHIAWLFEAVHRHPIKRTLDRTEKAEVALMLGPEGEEDGSDGERAEAWGAPDEKEGG